MRDQGAARLLLSKRNPCLPSLVLDVTVDSAIRYIIHLISRRQPVQTGPMMYRFLAHRASAQRDIWY